MRPFISALLLVSFTAATAWSTPPRKSGPALSPRQMQKLAPYAQPHWPVAKKRAWLRAKMAGGIADAEKVQLVDRKLAGMTSSEIDLLVDKYNRRQRDLERELLNEQKLADSKSGARRADQIRQYQQRLATARARGLGYRPVITTLPEGVNMGASAVVSPDRRYVRMTLSPFFSSIPEVSTFNFYTGQYHTYQLPGNSWNGNYYPNYYPNYYHYPNRYSHQNRYYQNRQNHSKNASYARGNTGFHGTITRSKAPSSRGNTGFHGTTVRRR